MYSFAGNNVPALRGELVDDPGPPLLKLPEYLLNLLVQRESGIGQFAPLTRHKLLNHVPQSDRDDPAQRYLGGFLGPSLLDLGFNRSPASQIPLVKTAPRVSVSGICRDDAGNNGIKPGLSGDKKKIEL